ACASLAAHRIGTPAQPAGSPAPSLVHLCGARTAPHRRPGRGALVAGKISCRRAAIRDLARFSGRRPATRGPQRGCSADDRGRAAVNPYLISRPRRATIRSGRPRACRVVAHSRELAPGRIAELSGDPLQAFRERRSLRLPLGRPALPIVFPRVTTVASSRKSCLGFQKEKPRRSGAKNTLRKEGLLSSAARTIPSAGIGSTNKSPASAERNRVAPSRSTTAEEIAAAKSEHGVP